MTRVTARPLTASAIFPLLAVPGRGREPHGVEPGSDAPSPAGGSQSRLLAGVVSSLLEVGRELPVLALAPALAAALDEPLPLERFGVRTSNLLQRAGLQGWRDLVVFSPTDLLALPNFGERSLRDVIKVGVERSLEIVPIVLAQEADGGDESGAEADMFLAGSNRLEERPDLLLRLADRVKTIGDLVPPLMARSSEELPRGLLPPRLANRGIARTWGELLSIPMATLLSLPSIGTRSVGALLDRVGDAARATADWSARPPLDEVRESLMLLATWAQQDRGISCLGDLIELRREHRRLPPALAGVWREIQAHVVPGPLPDDVIGAQIETLLGELSDRDRLVLGRRVWAVEGRWTLEQVGKELGLTRERVRQIEGSIISSLRDRLGSTRHRLIGLRAAELRCRLGSVAPVTSRRAKDAVRWASRDVAASHQGAARDLLLWLAGPYTSSEGWWRLASGAPHPKGNDLRDRASDSGLVPDDVVTEALDAAGVHPELHPQWMAAIGGFRKVDGGWLDSSGSIVEQSLRYLAFKGVPMTAEEILEGIGRTDASAHGNRQRLFEHPRAMRVSKSEIGLREWGHNEYTSLVDEMLQELQRAGGRMPLERMVERLVDQFGISPHSVRMYALRPLFLLGSDGFLQVRPNDQPYEVRDDLLRVPCCYELSPSEAAWRVQVDRGVLRGSGRHVPERLAGWLGLYPGQTTTLQNPFRPLAVAWRSWAQPDIGSLKPFAEELGASEGDWLVLVLGRRGTVDVRLVERSTTGRPELALLLQLLGLPAGLAADQRAALQAVGEVLGVDTSDEAALRFRIWAALQARRDQEVLELAGKVLRGRASPPTGPRLGRARVGPP